MSLTVTRNDTNTAAFFGGLVDLLQCDTLMTASELALVSAKSAFGSQRCSPGSSCRERPAGAVDEPVHAVVDVFCV